jgi:1-acyl-sn-glycerol-3-phosphate acyltransferase
MQKFISGIFLKIIGWNIYGSLPEGLSKAVLIAAPHTSNWDFVIGRAGFYKLGLKKVKFLIKKEMFKFPLGPVIKSWGAIPTDRGKNNNTIAQVSKMFAEEKKLLLLITPEGTRSYVEHWKKGFYHIATAANVPIVLTFVDYAKKEGGIGPVVYPTGNYEDDMKVIETFYRTKTAKFPENFNLSLKNSNISME